jgi:hypothetical protein
MGMVKSYCWNIIYILGDLDWEPFAFSWMKQTAGRCSLCFSKDFILQYSLLRFCPENWYYKIKGSLLCSIKFCLEDLMVNKKIYLYTIVEDLYFNIV